MTDDVRHRMRALREDAEAKVLVHLREHNWTVAVARELETDGGCLVIDAVRGGRRHRFAFIGAPPPSPDAYAALREDAEHVFVNGALERGETARGAEPHLTGVDAFF